MDILVFVQKVSSTAHTNKTFLKLSQVHLFEKWAHPEFGQFPAYMIPFQSWDHPDFNMKQR